MTQDDAADAYPGLFDRSAPLIATLVAALWFLPILASHAADADAYLVRLVATVNFGGLGHATAFESMQKFADAYQPGWYPLKGLPFYPWLLTQSVPAIKFFQYALIVATFATFAYVVKNVFASGVSALLATGIVLAACQLRMPHDPLIGTSLVVPLALEVWLLFLAACTRYARVRKPWLIGAAIVALIVGLLLSPTIAPLAVIFLAVGWFASYPRVLIYASGAAIVLFAVVAFVFGPVVMPWQQHPHYVHDVVGQMFAALPLSYRSFTGLHLYLHAPANWTTTSLGLRQIDDRFMAVPSASSLGIAIAAFLACAVFTAVRGARSKRDGSFAMCLCIGAAMWFVPALLLGNTVEWHSGLPVGQAFDNVLFAEFGLGVLGAALIGIVPRDRGFGAMLPSLVALAVFLCCYGNLRANATSLAVASTRDLVRSKVQDAAEAGFFDAIDEGQPVFVAGSMFFDKTYNNPDDLRFTIYQYAHRKYRIIARPQAEAWIIGLNHANDVVVGRSSVADPPRVTGGSIYDPTALWAIPPGSSAYGYRSMRYPLSRGQRIDVQRLCEPVAIDNLLYNDVPTIHWEDGFYRGGPSGYSNLADASTFEQMFMGSNATFEVFPSACRPRAVHMDIRLITDLVIGSVDATFGGHTISLPASLGGIDSLVTVPVSAGASTVVRLHTDAPVTDFDPILFRYANDRPRKLRAVVHVLTLSEQTAHG